jgi:hypothetical protein
MWEILERVYLDPNFLTTLLIHVNKGWIWEWDIKLFSKIRNLGVGYQAFHDVTQGILLWNFSNEKLLEMQTGYLVPFPHFIRKKKTYDIVKYSVGNSLPQEPNWIGIPKPQTSSFLFQNKKFGFHIRNGTPYCNCVVYYVVSELCKQWNNSRKGTPPVLDVYDKKI